MSTTAQDAFLQQNRGPEILAVSFPMAAVATLAVICRFISRKIMQLSWGKDDYATLIALILTWACVVSITVCVHYGAGRHLQTLSIPERVSFLKSVYALNEIYVATTPAIKIAVLLMYRRIFHTRTFKMVTNCFMSAVFIWWLGEALAAVFLCIPVNGFWDTAITAKCMSLRNFDVAYAVINITFDVVILCLPVRMVWRLNIQQAQKIALTFVFLLGGFECITALIRLLSSILDLSDEDLTFVVTDGFIWTAVEPSVGVISVCLPTMRPLISYIWPKQFGVKSSSRNKRTQTTEGTNVWHPDRSFRRIKENGFRAGPGSNPSPEATIVGAERHEGDESDPEHGIRVTTELELHEIL